MENNKKLSEELLKSDNINPANIPETERAMFKAMLDKEMKHHKKLSWTITGFLWIFVLSMLGLCMSEQILEKLHIPFVVAAMFLMTGVFIAIFSLLPKHYKQIKESSEKVHKLHFLTFGKYRGFPLVGKKNGKRYIDWLSIILLTIAIWFVMALSGAGVYYLLCRRWIYSGPLPFYYIFLCTIWSLSFIAPLLLRGLKAPLTELEEIKPKDYTCSRRKFSFIIIVVIIIAILLILNNSSIDITSNVYAEITENMQEMPWVHIRIISEYPTIDERIAEVDIWYSNNEQVIGMKDSIRVKFSYYQNEKKYDYDPDTNSITVSSISEADYSNSLINLKEGFDSWLKQYDQQGAEINHYLGEFEGEKVEIYETQEERGSGKIYVNSVSRLPIYAEFIDTYKGNQGNVQFHFEFPESGPKDIYDLGVPRDAPIIQKIPEENQ